MIGRQVKVRWGVVVPGEQQSKWLVERTEAARASHFGGLVQSLWKRGEREEQRACREENSTVLLPVQ